MNEILDRKENLEAGEIINLYYAFKTMYANDEHLEPLTVLLSKILGIAYDKLEGNIVLLPPETTIKMIDEEKNEKDIYVSIETSEKHYGNILEVSIRRHKFQDAYERDVYYFNKGISHSAMEEMSNDEKRENVLVRFTNFFVNKDHREAFEDFYLRDEVGNLLTRKSRILNINVEECYNLWRNNDYEGKFEPYEEDLMLLCAAMMVDNQEDFHNIISMVEMKPEIKVLMEGLVRQMSHDEELVTEYKTWKNEEECIQSSIIKEERRNGFNEGITQGIAQNRREIVLNMHKDNLDLDLIAKYVNLTEEEVKKIIDNN